MTGFQNSKQLASLSMRNSFYIFFNRASTLKENCGHMYKCFENVKIHGYCILLHELQLLLWFFSSWDKSMFLFLPGNNNIDINITINISACSCVSCV